MAEHTQKPWGLFVSKNWVEVHIGNDSDDDTIHFDLYGGEDAEGDAIRVADCRLIAAAPSLLAACKAQHDAIDTLFAMLISQPGSKFLPSQSGQPWDALVAGNAAIKLATEPAKP